MSRIMQPTRPTLQGLWTAAAALLFCSAPWWQPGAAGAILGLSLLGAWATALLWGHRALRGLQAEWLLPARCHVGDEVTLGLRLHAPHQLAPLLVLAPPTPGAPPLHLANLPAPGPAPTRIAWTRRFNERGRQRIAAPSCESRHPFGLLRRRQRCGDDGQVLVLPALGRVDRKLDARIDAWLIDLGCDEQVGDDELSHLRNYRPGDHPRRIHWRASARARSLIVAERHALAARSLALMVDTRVRHMPSRRLERQLATAATLIDHLIGQGFTLSLHGAFAPQGLEGDRSRLLDALALVEPAPTADLATYLPPHRACLVLCLEQPGAWAEDPLVMTLNPQQASELVLLPRSVR